jgi:hypothetical protein
MFYAMIQKLFSCCFIMALMASQMFAQGGDCTPTFGGSHPPAQSMYSLFVGSIDQLTQTELVQRRASLQLRVNVLRRLIDDHAVLLEQLRSCFNSCAGGDGSVSGNVAFRRCQQECKSRAIRLIQDYWSKWPETRQGISVTVKDYGELEIVDQYGTKSSAASETFYVAPQHEELRKASDEYDRTADSKLPNPMVFLMVPASGPDHQPGQPLRVLFSWLSANGRSDSLKANGRVKLVSMSSRTSSDASVLDTRSGTYFESPSNDGTHGMFLFTIPRAEASRYFQSIISRRRLVFDSDSQQIGDVQIDLNEEGLAVLDCIIKMCGR